MLKATIENDGKTEEISFDLSAETATAYEKTHKGRLTYLGIGDVHTDVHGNEINPARKLHLFKYK